jgi:hypothetical protein
MGQGKAPVGKDGKPVERRHEGQAKEGDPKEMTQEEHRGGETFKKNHPNTGQEPGKIDRSQFKQQRENHRKENENAGSGRDSQVWLPGTDSSQGSPYGHPVGKITQELLAAQGKRVNIGGSYLPDDAKCATAMRPSVTLNAINAAM